MAGIRRVDLVNGTPIVDIKPYLPFVDSLPMLVVGLRQMPRHHAGKFYA